MKIALINERKENVVKDTLMVYYSFEGNTGFVASELLKHMDMDVERIKVQQEPPKKGLAKFLHGGKSALRHEDPGLIPLQANVNDYYDIVIAFPVWAGTWPPAVEAFLRSYPFTRKNVFLIACSASGNASKALDKLTERLEGNMVLGTLSLKNPLKNKEEVAEQIRDFAARRH